MSSLNSKIVSHGSIYLAGNIIRRMVSFIMLPVYTRVLTPDNYGTLELLSMVLDFAAIICGLRIGEAVFRYYYAYDDEQNRNEVISTTLWLVGLLNLVAVLIIAMGARPISALVLGSPDYARLLALFSATLVFQSLTEAVLLYFRVAQRPWLFVGFSTAKLALQLGLNIYFVVVQRMAVQGVILSALISGIIVTVPLLWYTLSRTGLVFNREKAASMVRFSVPLLAASLISFYITFGDRYFLRVFGGGLEEVGIYSLGYRMGYILMFLVIDPFSAVWASERYVLARQPQYQARFQSVFLVYSAALAVSMAGIAVFSYDILRVMSDPAFWGAHVIIPIMMLGSILQAWTTYSNIGVMVHAKPSEVTIGTIIAAVVITAGYLLLIPPFGGVGAAIATTVAFGARLVWVSMRSERLLPLRLPWGRVSGMMALVAVAWTVSLQRPESLWLSLVTCTLIYAAFLAAFLYLPGLLPQDVRAWIIGAVRNPRRALQELRRPDAAPAVATVVAEPAVGAAMSQP